MRISGGNWAIIASIKPGGNGVVVADVVVVVVLMRVVGGVGEGKWLGCRNYWMGKVVG